jgi:predicted nucleic acid-binding protein
MAVGYLLDTTVISETRKVRTNPGVVAFLAATSESGLFLSVLTLGELHKGIEAKRKTDALAANRLADWANGIEKNFSDRILFIDTAVAQLWGKLSSSRSLPVIDTLIAATAIVHGLTLVTRNSKDILATKVPFIDPWQT